MNPSTPQLADPSTLDPYASAVTSANNAASTYQQAGDQLPSMLRDALNKKFSTDNPVIGQRSSALANYMQAGTAENARIKSLQDAGQIFSPTEQLRLNGAARANALIPVTTDNYLLGLYTGGVGNVIDSATGAFKASADAAANTAQNAQQNYQNKLAALNLQNDTATKAAALAQGQAPQVSMEDIGGRKVLLTYRTDAQGHTQVVSRVDLGSSTSGTGNAGISQAEIDYLNSKYFNNNAGADNGGGGSWGDQGFTGVNPDAVANGDIIFSDGPSAGPAPYSIVKQ